MANGKKGWKFKRKTQKQREASRRCAIKELRLFEKGWTPVDHAGFNVAMRALNNGIPLPTAPELPNGQRDWKFYLSTSLNQDLLHMIARF